MLKKMFIVFSVLMVLVAIVYVIGYFLPSQRTFIKTATLKSEIEEVFNLVTDIKKQPEWHKDVKEIQMIDSTTWTEVPYRGTPITFRTASKQPYTHFEIEIVEPTNFKGYWVGTFTSVPNGTMVVFKEVVIIDQPILKVFSWLFVNLDKIMDEYLTQLKQKLEA